VGGIEEVVVDEEGKELEKRSSVSLHWRKGTRFGYSYISLILF
jgi:hypothetical protein